MSWDYGELYFKLTPKGLRYIEGDYTVESKADDSGEILDMIKQLGAPNNSGAAWNNLLDEYADARWKLVSIHEVMDEYIEDLRFGAGTLEDEGLIVSLRSRGPDESLEVEDDYFTSRWGGAENDPKES